jgi:hypothetical protein
MLSVGGENAVSRRGECCHQECGPGQKEVCVRRDALKGESYENCV